MLSQTEKDLIRLLKACGLDVETTVGISGLCETDEKRSTLIEEIIYHYDRKGEITEQDIQKLCLMINGELKPEYRDRTSK